MDSGIASRDSADCATSSALRLSNPPSTSLMARFGHLFPRQETTE